MRNAILAVCFLFPFGFFACTEPIDIEMKENDTRLVVDGSFNTEPKAHTITLSKTTGYLSGQDQLMVEGASVKLTDGTHHYFLKENPPGKYKTNSQFQGVAGKQYTLQISLKEPVGGHADYEAVSGISEPVTLDSIFLEFYPDFSEEGMWEIRGYFEDPPGPDYYRFLVYRNSELATNSITDWFVTDDRFFEGRYVFGWTVAFLHQHRRREALAAGDRVTVQMDRISREYAIFIQGIQSEMQESYPLFSGPPANVKGNVSNGAIGFFEAYASSKVTVMVTKNSR